VNVFRWSWVMLGAIAVAAPGCLLVQPLDDVSTDSAGSGGSGAGKAGAGPSPSGGKGGAGPSASGGKGGGASGGRGGAGPTPTGGAPSVDFSYFTGTWKVTSGTITTDCGTGPIDTAAMPGTTDSLALGTTSDLILDKGTQCPILVDVNDLVATGQDGQTCDFSDASGTYHLEISFFDFIVGDDHMTATSHLTSVITLTSSGVDTVCDSNQELLYTR